MRRRRPACTLNTAGRGHRDACFAAPASGDAGWGGPALACGGTGPVLGQTAAAVPAGAASWRLPAGAPHDVWREVGVCRCSEATRDHLDHGHDHRGEGDLCGWVGYVCVWCVYRRCVRMGVGGGMHAQATDAYIPAHKMCRHTVLPQWHCQGRQRLRPCVLACWKPISRASSPTSCSCCGKMAACFRTTATLTMPAQGPGPE